MTSKEIRENGLLELYAMDACTPEEKDLVETLLAKHPELKQELLEIQDALNSFSGEFSQTPPPGLQAKIKSQLEFKPVAKTIAISNSGLNQNIKWYQYSLAASLLLVMGLGFMLYQAQNKLKDTEEKLVALNAEKTLLSENVNRTSIELNGLNQQLQTIQSDAFLPVKLKGTEKFPEARLQVYWNKDSKETYVSLVNMPDLPEGKQYQLWALVAGKPINAGVFDLDSGKIFLSNIATSAADVFAVTIEKTGGSESPTLSDLVVIGQVNG
jgi:anti-sigma-K factor RskA